MKGTKKNSVELTVCILAGGLSARMGKDKSRLRLGGRTMLGHILATAGQLGHPVRVIRRDSIPRSGPIGGIYTALHGSRADKVLFLACDMPFVSPVFLRKMIREFPRSGNAIFARAGALAGFPCLLRRENSLPLVSQQIEKSEFSLQTLARLLNAKLLRSPRPASLELANVNTPFDLTAARRRLTPIRPRLRDSGKRPKSQPGS